LEKFMSRIGKKPVAVPSGVQASLAGQTVKVKGPKGELSLTLVDDVKAQQTAEGIELSPVDDSKRARAMWGMSRTLVDNMMKGVTAGYTETLEINGVGYRAAMKGKDLQLLVGLSHDVIYPIPQGITIQLDGPKKDSVIVITGIDKQKVGQVAAEIRSYRKPEPYQGKGVKYRGEFILRKEGKKK
jgi:large subunit ribosomal protein L6